MPKTQPTTRTKFVYQTTYSDGSERTRVEYDSTLRLGDDDVQYISIKGVGGDTLFPLDRADGLVDAIREAQAYAGGD